MIPASNQKPGYRMPSILHRQAKSGFTLIEMLMCMTMLALIMLPFTLAMSSSAQSGRQAYLQSTRTILLNSLKNETCPTDPSYVTKFTDGSMQTGVSDSGTVVGYRRVVNATTSGATNAIKRTTHFYLYTNTTDASSAARYKTTVVSYPKVFRYHFGNATDVIDTLNRYWYADNFGDTLYDTTNKVPGWASSKATAHTTTDILNTSGNDDQLYQNVVTLGGGGTLNMDVDNGAYTVKILWAEQGTSINGTTNARRHNIFINDVQVNSTGPYSVYESTGAAFLGQITMYDVNVTNQQLKILFSLDSSSGAANADPSAIEVIRRSAL